MQFFRFLFSKTFLIQLTLAAISLVVVIFLIMKWLNYTTNHDERIQVPNLQKLNFSKSSKVLKELDLVAKIQDSANFDPNFPPLSVIEHSPKAGDFVKKNRKIYLVLNPSGYRKVKVPDVIQKTRRQAEPTLRAIGFKVGKIIYRPNIAKDVVLGLSHNGKTIKPDTQLMKTSTIDLVVGDGLR